MGVGYSTPLIVTGPAFKRYVVLRSARGLGTGNEIIHVLLRGCVFTLTGVGTGLKARKCCRPRSHWASQISGIALILLPSSSSQALSGEYITAGTGPMA